MLQGAEIKQVRTRAPWSIIISSLSNGIMEWAFAICILYTIGNVDLVTGSDTGLPIIEIFYQATDSKPVTTLFVVAPAIVLYIALFNVFASVSRLSRVFARNHGLPSLHSSAR